MDYNIPWQVATNYANCQRNTANLFKRQIHLVKTLTR